MRLIRTTRSAVWWREAVIIPYTCNPDDALKAQRDMRMNYFCGDVQVRGEYPYFAKRMFRELGVELETQEGDDEILRRGKVDFYSFAII